MFVWSKLSTARWADSWEERLAGINGAHLAISSAPGKKTIRLELYCDKAVDAERVRAEFGGRVREVKPQNWAALSNEPMPPIKVRDELLICSARSEAALKKARQEYPGRQVIAVPADMAFGTGHHATTATSLRMLVDAAAALKGKPWTMADLGCGSGILAIAAIKLGASKVWGCDFDPKAVEVSRENASRNNAAEIRFTQTDVLKWEPKTCYDVVVANIFFDILHAGFPQIVRAVKPEGKLIVSGILKTQAAECLAVAEGCGVRWERVVTKGKWVTAKGRRLG